jgi:pyruvate dehydrogenase E2 component (dihydrolipoamide acetyltransferase)
VTPVEITMPQLGESVTEGTILRWFKSVGEPIEANEVLFEVATDKVDAEVPSPVAGVLTDIRIAEGATVPVGAVLAVVDGAVPTTTTPTPAAPPATVPAAAPTTTEPTPVPPSAEPGPVTERALVHASPLARRILREAGVAPSDVTGTGRLDRITRRDAEQAATRRRSAGSPPAAVGTPAVGGVVGPPPPPGTPPPSGAPQPPRTAAGGVAPSPAGSMAEGVVGSGDGREVAIPMNRIRRRTAAHMVSSRATSPHALVATEVRYDNVERVRQAHRETFRASEETSLTYLPFIARATIDALRQFPRVNASVLDDASDAGLALHGDVNLAIAVDLDFVGLVAPVLHHADDLRLRAVARRLADAARRARAGDLGPDDLTGGTFTISNSGSFGTHLVIPIINQPQVAILSTDAVRRRPVVVRTDDGGEAIAIGSVGLLALSWDQRAFDGAYASAFLDEVRAILETRDWEVELR